MGYKFNVGDRVVTTGCEGSCLLKGRKGTVIKRQPHAYWDEDEYIFVPDEGLDPRVTGYAVNEEALEAEDAS